MSHVPCPMSHVIKNTDVRVKPDIGIPQGGIDSPYLWNIYMFELDNFVHNELQAHVEKLNLKVNNKRIFSKPFNSENET